MEAIAQLLVHVHVVLLFIVLLIQRNGWFSFFQLRNIVHGSPGSPWFAWISFLLEPHYKFNSIGNSQRSTCNLADAAKNILFNKGPMSGLKFPIIIELMHIDVTFFYTNILFENHLNFDFSPILYCLEKILFAYYLLKLN